MGCRSGPEGKVFGFFYSTWGINFTLLGNSLADADGPQEVGNGCFGDYAVCEGPQPYYWGGTWICAAAGTDNVSTIRDVMLKLTCDKESPWPSPRRRRITQLRLRHERAGRERLSVRVPWAGRTTLRCSPPLRRRSTWSNVSPYDQGCNEGIQTAFKDYFNGVIDLDTAKANFETLIMESIPT